MPKIKIRSLFDIIENYLNMLPKEETSKDLKKLNPVVKSLKDSFKMPKNIDYKKELINQLEEKYL